MVPDDQDLKTKYREVIEKMVLARSEQEKINIQTLLSSVTNENLSIRPKSTKVSFFLIKTELYNAKSTSRNQVLSKINSSHFFL